MTTTPHDGQVSVFRMIPREIVTIVGTAAAIFAVVVTGGMISSNLPEQLSSPWLVMASYAAPAAVAFLAHWWLSQRR